VERSVRLLAGPGAGPPEGGHYEVMKYAVKPGA
jgi:hypothetical protein